jgi:hypothetical protein
MKKFTPYPWLAVSLCLFFSFSAFSQTDCSVLQVNNAAAVGTRSASLSYWSGIMELPFLLISIFFAFGTASALRGGKFGKGMNLLAWGFLVMAIGHMHMQVEHFYGFNLFKYLLGEMGGSIVWFIALVITWGFSGLGFYSIYKASKGG